MEHKDKPPHTGQETLSGNFTKRLIALNQQTTEPTTRQNASGGALENDTITVTERDIIFDCPQCNGELIVDREGEGIETACIHCGVKILVPKYDGPPPIVGRLPASRAKVTIGEDLAGAGGSAPSQQEENKSVAETQEQIADDIKEFKLDGLTRDELVKKLDHLKRQLKENNSQVTEVTGYVNQTSIKLHRFKLQLDRLKKRNIEINRELGALKSRLGEGNGSA